MTDTTIWLYTLPGVVLEGSYYHLINTNLGYFWCWDKSVFKRLLGFRSWTITQYLIPLWFWWYLTPVLSLYHLCIMVCFKYTPHTNYDIWYEVSQSVSQNCLKVPPVYLKVPRKYLKVPPLFSGTSWIWPQRKSMGMLKVHDSGSPTTAKNIIKQYQNYSNETCGSNVMKNILFMAAIFKNGSRFKFFGC